MTGKSKIDYKIIVIMYDRKCDFDSCTILRGKLRNTHPAARENNLSGAF